MLPPLLLVLWRGSLSCDSKIFMARRRNKKGNVFLQSLEVQPFMICRISTRFCPLEVPPHTSSFTLGTELVTLEYMNLWRTLHVQTQANNTCLCKMGWLVLISEGWKILCKQNWRGHCSEHSKPCSWHHTGASTLKEPRTLLIFQFFVGNIDTHVFLFVSLSLISFFPCRDIDSETLQSELFLLTLQMFWVDATIEMS